MIVKHIVLFQFKEEVKKSAIEFAKKQLEQLRQLDDIVTFEIGEDIETSVFSNFHLCVNCTFSNMEQLEKYQQHPLHIEFACWLKTVLQQRACVDYFI